MVTRTRVAVIGGDGRFNARGLPNVRIRIYQSSRYGGNGPLRRLERSIKANGVDMVIIVTRWIGHSEARRIRHLCRQLRIPVELRA